MAKEHEQKTMIPIGNLVPRKGNRTIGASKENLDGLIASIREKGIITPLLVRPIGGESFEVVCGHRRRLAALAIGLKEVPCNVRPLGDLEAEEIAAIDNLQREDLHPLDEAALYESLTARARADLIENPEAAVEQVAARVGKPLPYVRARMKLLSLSQKARLTWLEGKGEKIALGHALVLCRYPAAVQDQLITWISKEWQPPTVKDLQEHIERSIHVELAKAPFSMKDADLLPQAGACLTCPKRTGADRLLFPEVGKKDLCLDPKCYQAKVKATLENRMIELKTHTDPYYLVSNGYDYGEKLPAGTLQQHHWQRAKKSEEKDAVRCLIVHGEDVGTFVYGFKARDGGMHGQRQVMSPKEKAQRAKQIEENRVNREIVNALLDRTLTGLREIFGDGLKIPEGFTRALALRNFERLHGHNETKLCKALGWEQSKEKTGGRHSFTYASWKPTAKCELAKMTLPEVHLFIARCLLAESLPPDPQDTELLRELSGLANLDPKKIEVEIRGAAKAKSKNPRLTKVSKDSKVSAKKKGKKRPGTCSVCGCTDKDCSQCIAKTGEPCHWVDSTRTLCSACAEYPDLVGAESSSKKASKKHRVRKEDRALAVSTD